MKEEEGGTKSHFLLWTKPEGKQVRDAIIIAIKAVDIRHTMDEAIFFVKNILQVTPFISRLNLVTA